MKRAPFWNDESVSPVLGAILMLAIGITILTSIQLNFVPVWNAEEELNHLNKMQDDFKGLKSGIESSVQSGTTLSVPLSMGFKYSPKIFVYNPKESAFASLDIQNNTWAEIRYNELLTGGVDDATSIKNVTSSTITYSLQSTQNYRPFIYEHGLIRRSGSEYSTSPQTIVANRTVKLISVRPLGSGTANGVGKKIVNVYPTSQQKNSVVGRKAYLIVHTRPEYVKWWNASLLTGGGEVRKEDSKNGKIIYYFDSAVIKMGEAYISTATNDNAPAHASPFRLIKITSEDKNLPVEGTTDLAVEVQDYYNNPVPNVRVNFSINTSQNLSNACSAGGCSLQDSVPVSGADGRANVMLKTSDAGFYYIDAALSQPPYKTTFVYPASSQGYVMPLSYSGSEPNYIITARLTSSIGQAQTSQYINFSAGEGQLNPASNITNSTGYAIARLNTSNATGIKITNIQTGPFTRTSAGIKWDTVNNITVTAKKDYVFNSIQVPTNIVVPSCVQYGTSPENYTSIQCDNASSHSITLTGLRINTPYYFIINASRGGVNVNSTEYMFVTALPDFSPPSSVTNLINSTYQPLYIIWTWTDPPEDDFDHVEVYVDNIFTVPINVSAGVRAFNATFFKPNSTHTIFTRTNDFFGDLNVTWVNDTATTAPAYTYVDNFLNSTGTVMDFDNSRSAGDGGASAQFIGSFIMGLNQSENYTNVSGYVNTRGSLINFSNMTNSNDGGAFATMTEELTNTSTQYKWAFTNNNESWTSSYSWISQPPGAGYVYMGFNATSGNPNGSIYSGLVGDNAKARAARTNWTSPNFTWAGGPITAASLKFDWKVEKYNLGDPASNFYVDLVKPDSTTSRIYQSEIFNGITGWVNKFNNTVSPNEFSQSGNYSLRLTAELYVQKDNTANVEVRWDNPTLMLNYTGTTYALNITTNFSQVPMDTNNYLEINYSVTNDDNYSVLVFNGSSWNNRGTLNSTSWTVFNYTLTSAEYNGGVPRLRYVDTNQSGITQGKLYVDYQRIHGFTPQYSDAYKLDVITNTTAVPDKSTQQTLQIRYNTSNGIFNLQTWNGSWNTRATLSATSMASLDIPLSSDELLPYDTLTGNVSTLDRFYVRVRYQGENPAAMGEGRLYLDYQRVYTT